MKNSRALGSIRDVRNRRQELKYELEIAKIRFAQRKNSVKRELDPLNLYYDLVGRSIHKLQEKLSFGLLGKIMGMFKAKPSLED